MLSRVVLILAGLWTTAISSPFLVVGSNSTRKIFRLTGTFSVLDSLDPSLDTRFGGLDTRFGGLDTRFGGSSQQQRGDAVIRFMHRGSVISAAPGRIDRDISQGILQMALNMDKTIGSEGKALLHDQNTIFSPASISMALALVLLGARGRTLQEVSKVLGIATPESLQDNLVHEQFGTLLARFDRNPSSNNPTQVSIANGVFVQRDYPISERYERLSRSLYRSDVLPVDYRRDAGRAAQTINSWVAQKTLGRIRDLLPEPPAPETQILLASAIYFNGQWETPFPLEATRKRPFYVSGSKQNEVGTETVEVDMMANGLEVPYVSDSDLDCQLVGLPYKGGKVVMWVVLPNARGFEGLNALKAKLTSQGLDNLVSKASVTSIIVTLPRMKLEATLNLRSVLQAMGIECLFDARCSDLGEISSGVGRSRPNLQRPLASSNNDRDRLIFSSRFGDTNDNGDSPAHEQDRRRQTKSSRHRQSRQANPGLYVDDVIHKVEIEVNEVGTVASAATALSISRDGGHRVVRLDRPFLFFIREEDSKLMLFWGAVVRPT